MVQNTTDLRLRYESVRAVDQDRFAVWARQLGIDAVAGDVTGLELVREWLGGGISGDLKAAREAAGVSGRPFLRDRSCVQRALL
ncbi:hypothetical protein [Streptomyces sp. S.PB5]|uniref:hypothetical protein n=1 Tax=Streptomyces sp. S.PB5 TaxID=3020844 RepID=UPI0025AFE0DA|nr:hypothetical protein [Streptomyces sp. S.PB5]MDN3020405.1 hypothetical protein [Streptomyces sp. S.PB5]